MVGARAYNYIKPLQIASLLWVGANAPPYNSEVGASLHCINFGRAIDPCMGSGHILVYAFDVFMQIYENAGWSKKGALSIQTRITLFQSQMKNILKMILSLVSVIG